jgi:hypothetical protein
VAIMYVQNSGLNVWSLKYKPFFSVCESKLYRLSGMLPAWLNSK